MTQKKSVAKKATAKPTAKKPVIKKTVAKPVAKKTVAKKAAAKPTAKKQGVGAFCKGLISAGKSNDEVLKAVQAKFPDANTSANSVSWYRSQMNSESAA